jgi:hypothetical protein
MNNLQGSSGKRIATIPKIMLAIPLPKEAIADFMNFATGRVEEADGPITPPSPNIFKF